MNITEFKFAGNTYAVDADEADEFILLPTEPPTLLRVTGWLESYPPQIAGVIKVVRVGRAVLK